MKLSSIYISTSDLIFTAVFLLLILFLLLFLERLSNIGRLSALFTRKSVHLLVGLFIVFAILILDTVYPILILSVVFFVFDWWAIRSQRFKSIHPDKNSYGTVYYPLAVFILSIVLWNSFKIILIISILIMSVADVSAAVAGERYAKMAFIPYREKKSIPGSAAMLFSSFLIIFTIIGFFTDRGIYNALIIGSVVAIQATAAEMISSRGSDNLSVPAVSALFLLLMLETGQSIVFLQLTVGTFLALFIGIASYYAHFLMLSGVIGVIVMGGIIFGLGGIAYTLPILFFFISSSILSYFKKEYKQKFRPMFEKSGARDIFQVFANGGIATILMLATVFFQHRLLFPLYLTAVAAAAADTWATELGVLSHKKPRLINTWKTAEKGTSGAISLSGSLAALIGSILTVTIGFLFQPEEGLIYKHYLIAAFCGFFSSNIDSFLGATVQSQYSCVICGKFTEKKIHCHEATQLFSGSRMVQNDTVNIISILLSVFLCFVLISL